MHYFLNFSKINKSEIKFLIIKKALNEILRPVFDLCKTHYKILTSHSSFTPNFSKTFFLARFINSIASVKVAPPVLIKKFAWISLNFAAPIWKPFKPAASINLPAKSPFGFLKTLPKVAFFGWFLRFAKISLLNAASNPREILNAASKITPFISLFL